MLIAPTRFAPVAVALASLVTLTAGRSEAGGFRLHHGHQSSSVVTTRGQTVRFGTTANTLTFGPATTFTGQSLQLAPTAFTGQSLQLAPNTLTSGPQTTLQLVGGASTGSSLTLSGQNSGAQTLTLNSGANDLDTAYQVLTLGFGNNAAKVIDLEEALNGKLETLSLGAGGGLNEIDLRSILLETARGFLRTNGFGILIDGAVEPILGRIIDKVIGNRRARRNGGRQPNNQGGATRPAQPTTPTIEIPAGGRSFNISGRIILTPSSVGPEPVEPDTVPPPDTDVPPRPTVNAEIEAEDGVNFAPEVP